jgi:hypothetical protein
VLGQDRDVQLVRCWLGFVWFSLNAFGVSFVFWCEVGWVRYHSAGGAESYFRWRVGAVGRLEVLWEDWIQKCWGKHMSVRVDCVLLSFVRYTMTGMLRWPSREEVLMMADFLAAADVAFDWLPVGSPMEVVDVVYLEYLGYAREDFSLLVGVFLGEHVAPRSCLLLWWIERELLCRREATARRCLFYVTGSTVI